MGWKEDLAAELAEEGQKLRDAGVTNLELEEQQRAEAEALKSQDQQIEEAGQTLRDNEVEYQGEADLNEVIETVEEEGAPQVHTAEPEPEAAPEPEETSWDNASPETHAEYQAYLDEANADIPLPEPETEITEPATDTPEVTEPEAPAAEVTEPETETAEVTEPEAEAPEVTEPEAPETDDFEAWADSKAPAAPEQGQELEQEQPEQAEPEQVEMDLDER